jgi:hypothetical protein
LKNLYVSQGYNQKNQKIRPNKFKKLTIEVFIKLDVKTPKVYKIQKQKEPLVTEKSVTTQKKRFRIQKQNGRNIREGGNCGMHKSLETRQPETQKTSDWSKAKL